MSDIWPPPETLNRPPVYEGLPEKLIDAYRINPLLGALFLLNVLTIVGFGWYMLDKESKTATYVLQMQADMKELRIKAMDIASECSSLKTTGKHK